jgi:WD40 repeat protein
VADRLHLVIVLVLFAMLLTACGAQGIDPTASLTGQGDLTAETPSSSTSTPIPVTPSRSPSATSTAATTTPAPSPTPSPVYPFPYPEPYLPANLELISAVNIDRLVLLSSLPVKEIYDLEFSPSGNMVATLSEPPEDRFNDYMEVWDLRTGQQVLLVDHWDSPYGLFFPPDESTLYAGDRQYELSTGELVNTLPVSPDAFTTDGKIYASGEYSGTPDISTIVLIDINTGSDVYSTTYTGMVMSVRFSPDGRWMSGGFQGNHFHVVTWDLSTMAVAADLIDYDANLTFSADRRLAATTKNYQIYLFSTDQMTWLNTIGFTDEYANPYIQDFSTSGDMLAYDDRNTIHFVDPLTGKNLGSLDGECYEKFSPNGKILLTWCSQSNLKIWGVMP